MDKTTKVTLPVITFNFGFKTKKEARQAAIRSLMGCMNDAAILGQIKVETQNKKPATKKVK